MSTLSLLRVGVTPAAAYPCHLQVLSCSLMPEMEEVVEPWPVLEGELTAWSPVTWPEGVVFEVGLRMIVSAIAASPEGELFDVGLSVVIIGLSGSLRRR